MPPRSLSITSSAILSPNRLTLGTQLRPVSVFRAFCIHEGRKRLHCAVEHYKRKNIRLSMLKSGHFPEKIQLAEMDEPFPLQPTPLIDYLIEIKESDYSLENNLNRNSSIELPFRVMVTP